MQAVINLNGKQYQVEEGTYLKVDRLSQAQDEVFEIGNVLMVLDGESSLLGAPFVDGASVKVRVLNHGRDGKILVYKMRCKKGYRRKNGHRQGFTRIQIEDLIFPGKKASTKPAKEAADKTEPAAKAGKAKPEGAEKPTAKKAAAPKKAVEPAAEPKATEAKPETQSEE